MSIYCSIENCSDIARTRDWCPAHYMRFLRTGTPLGKRGRPEVTRVARTPEERFWCKVQRTQGCWLWTGSTRRQQGGYGQIAQGGQIRLAHRVAWEMEVGPIPPGFALVRTCSTPSCVAPAHHELVTRAENGRRARAQHRSSAP